MSDSLDYYDVQAMIRDARSEIRAEIDNAVRATCRELRAELAEAIDNLRGELSSLTVALNSRTERLV